MWNQNGADAVDKMLITAVKSSVFTPTTNLRGDVNGRYVERSMRKFSGTAWRSNGEIVRLFRATISG